MFTRKFVTGAVVPAAFAAFVGVSAQTNHASAAQTCVFDKYPAVSVAPYSAEENVGYGTYTFLRGAQLYVRAQEGLTKEWLELSIQKALASDQACRPDAKPEVKPVKVSVTSAGNGFWVQLIAHDEKQAEVLLHWARTVVQQHAEEAAAKAAAPK